MRVALGGSLVGLGGIQTHFKWLATALAEAGHQVLILSLGASPQDTDRVRSEALSQSGKISVSYVNNSSTDQRSAADSIRYLAQQLREFEPDAYLACGTGWNLFIPAILSRSCGTLIFHEVMAGDGGNWRDTRWLARWFFGRVFAQANPVARNFKETFGWRNSIEVLPAFPEPLEKTACLPAVTRHAVPMGRARAAFFGRLAPHKQAFWLVRQWALLADSLAELHIFGSGEEEPLIRSFITANDLGNRVFCHGSYPSGQDYVDLLSGFDLTLLPTVGAEGAPLVLLESMACGVPFVAFDVGGIPDYANPDCEIRSALDLNSFVPAVHHLARRLAEQSVDQGRLQRFYLDHFSFDRLKLRWIAALIS